MNQSAFCSKFMFNNIKCLLGMAPAIAYQLLTGGTRIQLFVDLLALLCNFIIVIKSLESCVQPAITHYITSKSYPFSDAIKAGGFVFLSGQVAMDDKGNTLYGSIEDQTCTIMHNISLTLARAGCTLNDIIRVKVWLSDMKHFASFNTTYQSFFKGAFPVRTLSGATLVLGLDVEIEAQALANNSDEHK